MAEDLPGVIGGAVPSPRNLRLLGGRGRFTADIPRPGALHAAFLRSPHAHARIAGMDTTAAAAMPGVARVLTAADLAPVCAGFRGGTAVHPELVAPEQHALAVDVARYHGEPVALVLATSRALAEDACARIAVDWQTLPPIPSPEAALAAPPLHPGCPDNIALELNQSGGAPRRDGAQEVAFHLRFNRQTGVPLETRAILAEYEPGEGRLDVVLSHQCPHQMQEEYARLLRLEPHLVRVRCPDVGGAFGVKQQLYGDELAVCAAAVLTRGAVRFTADRPESLLSDIQAREHVVGARLSVSAEGDLLDFETDDLFGIGAYPQYPRSTLGEPRAIMGLTGAPYRYRSLASRCRVVFQTKPMSGHYRGVGHPLACTVTEVLVEEAARAIGMDPVEIRRRNFLTGADLPHKAASGTLFERLAFPECLAALERKVDFDVLRAEVATARGEGRLQGWGLAAFVEQTARGPGFYGQGGQAVSSRDGCTVRLEPSGRIRAVSSVTEQGQGTEMGVRQVIAAALGVTPDAVEVVTGDTAQGHHGGGTWGSRGMAIGGEAAWRAARDLRAEILALAARRLDSAPDRLDIAGEAVVLDGTAVMPLADLAADAHFRPYLFGADCQPQLAASATYGPQAQPFRCGTGIQLSHVEIDPGTGQIRLLRHVVAHEAGRVVNPQLVDGQIRGGVAQGLGAALMEECAYDTEGRSLSASLMTYTLPMAVDLPEIELAHAESPPFTDDGLGIVGVGEAGIVGAGAAVMNAVNDALSQTGARLHSFPMTPPRVLRALGLIGPEP